MADAKRHAEGGKSTKGFRKRTNGFGRALNDWKGTTYAWWKRVESIGRTHGDLGIYHAGKESRSSDNRMRYNIFGILCLGKTALRSSETGMSVHASETRRPENMMWVLVKLPLRIERQQSLLASSL